LTASNDTKHQPNRAALYCRVASSSHQDAQAIFTQRLMLREFAEQQGFEIVGEYLESGISGHTLDRPIFMQMEQAIKASEVDTVIVRCISRISRNYLLTEKWRSDLVKQGVKLIAVDGSHMPTLLEIEIAKFFSTNRHLY